MGAIYEVPTSFIQFHSGIRYCICLSYLMWLRIIQKRWFIFYTSMAMIHNHGIGCYLWLNKVLVPSQNCECRLKWNQPFCVTQPLNCIYLEQFIHNPSLSTILNRCCDGLFLCNTHDRVFWIHSYYFSYIEISKLEKKIIEWQMCSSSIACEMC